MGFVQTPLPQSSLGQQLLQDFETLLIQIERSSTRSR